jgi:hypothetical protein
MAEERPRGLQIAFIGDSVTRFQFVALLSHLERNGDYWHLQNDNEKTRRIVHTLDRPGQARV